MSRRYAILAPGLFATRSAKTAHGVIAYAEDPTVAVIDPQHAGKRICDVLPYLKSEAPIVATLAQAREHNPDTLLVGVAAPGGALPASWRREIVAALEGGLDVVSGLHDVLATDPEFAAAAARAGANIRDIRLPPDVPLFSGQAYDLKARVVLTVGTDCAVGKMTASLELVRAARARGERAVFVPTGQTGIAIAGWGISVDRTIADFTAGAAEQLVLEGSTRGDLLFVEGQGSCNHPAYAGVTISLLFGSAPDALILVHSATRSAIEPYNTPILTYRDYIGLYEGLTASLKPARVIGIVLNTLGLSEEAALDAIERARVQTHLPADDIVRFGCDAFYAAIAPAIGKSNKLCAS